MAELEGEVAREGVFEDVGEVDDVGDLGVVIVDAEACRRGDDDRVEVEKRDASFVE